MLENEVQREQPSSVYILCCETPNNAIVIRGVEKPNKTLRVIG